MRKYEDENCLPLPLNLPPGVREIVAAFHDESCFHANDQKKRLWLTDSQQILRQKSRGRLVHVSDFIVEDRGRIFLNEAEVKAQMSLDQSERLESFDARTIIYPGKNGDGYWDMKQLLEQVSSGFLEQGVSATVPIPEGHVCDLTCLDRSERRLRYAK